MIESSLRSLFICCGLFFGMCHGARAQESDLLIRAGSEFTFTNEQIKKSFFEWTAVRDRLNYPEVPYSPAGLEAMTEEYMDYSRHDRNLNNDFLRIFFNVSLLIAKRMKVPYVNGLRNSQTHGKERVTYFNGGEFSIVYSVDPAVLEIKASMEYLSTWEKNKKLLHHLTFTAAKAVGVGPDLKYGGGHISVLFEDLVSRGSLLPNIFADAFNHPELTTHVFGDGRDQDSIPFHASRMDQLDVEHFKIFLGWLPTAQSTHLDFSQLADLIDPFSYKYQRPLVMLKGGGSGGPLRVEFRFFQAQFSAQEFIDQVEFLQQWLRGLDTLPEVVGMDEHIRLPNSDREAAERFYSLILKRGIDPHLALRIVRDEFRPHLADVIGHPPVVERISEQTGRLAKLRRGCRKFFGRAF